MTADKPQILLIEGKRADRPSFLSGLVKKGYLVESVPNGSAALTLLNDKTPHLVLIDAASMRTSGIRICQSVHASAPAIPIILVVDEKFNHPNSLEARVILKQPFTLQKLLNRIRPLIPAGDNKLLKVGSIVLDIEHRWVRSGERQTRLTPRLVSLLKILMTRRGEVIDRNELFRKVWETSYTGDTRTLDVHISWLREALEDDTRHPRYIKTVRGVGYRIDLESDVAQPSQRVPTPKS